MPPAAPRIPPIDTSGLENLKRMLKASIAPLETIVRNMPDGAVEEDGKPLDDEAGRKWLARALIASLKVICEAPSMSICMGSTADALRKKASVAAALSVLQDPENHGEDQKVKEFMTKLFVRSEIRNGLEALQSRLAGVEPDFTDINSKVPGAGKVSTHFALNVVSGASEPPPYTNELKAMLTRLAGIANGLAAMNPRILDEAGEARSEEGIWLDNVIKAQFMAAIKTIQTVFQDHDVPYFNPDKILDDPEKRKDVLAALAWVYPESAYSMQPAVLQGSDTPIAIGNAVSAADIGMRFKSSVEDFSKVFDLLEAAIVHKDESLRVAREEQNTLKPALAQAFERLNQKAAPFLESMKTLQAELQIGLEKQTLEIKPEIIQNIWEFLRSNEQQKWLNRPIQPDTYEKAAANQMYQSAEALKRLLGIRDGRVVLKCRYNYISGGNPANIIADARRATLAQIGAAVAWLSPGSRHRSKSVNVQFEGGRKSHHTLSIDDLLYYGKGTEWTNRAKPIAEDLQALEAEISREVTGTDIQKALEDMTTKQRSAGR